MSRATRRGLMWSQSSVVSPLRVGRIHSSYDISNVKRFRGQMTARGVFGDTGRASLEKVHQGPLHTGNAKAPQTAGRLRI